MIGKVKIWLVRQGYGFIIAEDGREVFAHHSDILGDDDYKSLRNGSLVEFELEDTPRGLKAVNIKQVTLDCFTDKGVVQGGKFN